MDFLNWMLDHGRSMTSELAYAPLPDNVAAKVREAIKQVQVGHGSIPTGNIQSGRSQRARGGQPAVPVMFHGYGCISVTQS